MILNKESLINLLKQYGCDYFLDCQDSIIYHGYRFLTFLHYEKNEFRLHSSLVKSNVYSYDGLKCKFTDTSPEFILSHLEKFKMWVDRLSLNEKKEKLSKMVEQINEDFV
jgi:hypothetical protein